jgi:hypothetical protein
MTESKAIAKTKFTVVTIWYNSSSGSEYGTNYFWINQETNAKLIEVVGGWARKYFHGDHYEWDHEIQTDVLATTEDIRVMHNTPMNDDEHCIISKQVKNIPSIPDDMDEEEIPEWVLKTLSDLSD